VAAETWIEGKRRTRLQRDINLVPAQSARRGGLENQRICSAFAMEPTGIEPVTSCLQSWLGTLRLGANEHR
jgi:hypothetical protein